MKLLLSLALAFHLTATAQAAPEQACAFGENSSDLIEKIQSKERHKALYEGESLHFTSPQRLGGISRSEKTAILRAMKYISHNSQDSEAELLNDFVAGEGYMQYFRHNDGREFVAIGSFPGDNEFGLVLEISRRARETEFKITQVAAEIEDGDIANCKVVE